MWAGDAEPGLGALRRTRRPRPEGPQALQVPQGRRDLCVCVCVRVGRGAGLHTAFCGFGGSGELEAVPRGLGRPGLGAGRVPRALGEGETAALGLGRGPWHPRDLPPGHPSLSDPRAQAEDGG